MRGVVFVNGEVSDYRVLSTWLAEGDYLVAADGGARHCVALGLVPHAIVGDMDSVPPEMLRDFAARGVSIERHPERKDKTDLELAVERAIRDGADEVLLLGALGGRLDQTLANLLLSARRTWSVPVALADGAQLAQILRGGERMELDAPQGSMVSVVPLSEEVTGITYEGLEYPLQDATLALGSTRGISNVVVDAPAAITIERGVLVVVQEVAPGQKREGGE